MSWWEIVLLILVGIVAVGMFVWIIRSDTARVRKGLAEAAARGEPAPKWRPPLTLVYFVIGLGFVVAGLLTLNPR
ncbi:MAG: hypothetical protein ABJA11_01455 [Pseudolysinimonas sp.]